MNSNSILSSSSNITFIVKLKAPSKQTNTKIETKNQQKSKQINQNSTDNKTNNKYQTHHPPQTSLTENIKYTMFTSDEISDALVVTNQPILGKSINQSVKSKSDLFEFNSSLLPESTIWEYDVVYPQMSSSKAIYNNNIRGNISKLFHGKSSCVWLFGSENSGTSDWLSGKNSNYIEKENGILGRSIDDVFKFVDLTNQANDKIPTKTYFVVYISTYVEYLDSLYDLSSKSLKMLKVEKYYDNNAINCNIINICKTELKSRDDYTFYFKQVVRHFKEWGKKLKVNNIESKGNLVVSIGLEKREFSDFGKGCVNDRFVEDYAQIDFVEVVRSNYGWTNDIQLDTMGTTGNNGDKGKLFSHANKTLNSLSNNLISIAAGVTPRIETKWTTCLKKTLRRGCSIWFINCAIPWECPLGDSYKSLKYTNWLRSQIGISRMQNNGDWVQSVYIENKNEESEENNQDGNMKISSYQNTVHEADNDRCDNIRGNANIKQTRRIQSDDIEARDREMTDSNNNLIEETRKQYDHNHEPWNNSNTFAPTSMHGNWNKNTNSLNSLQSCSNPTSSIRHAMINPNLSIINNKYHNASSGEQTIEQSYNNLNNATLSKESQLFQLEKSLQTLQQKNAIITSQLRSLRQGPSSSPSKNITNTPSFNPKVSTNFEQDFTSLQNDNIIFREDIASWTHNINKYENQIKEEKEKANHLWFDNERMLQENQKILQKIKDITLEQEEKTHKEKSIYEKMNENFTYESRIREYENANKKLKEAKSQYEVEYNIVKKNYEDIRSKCNTINTELALDKQAHNSEVAQINNKVDSMMNEIEMLKQENKKWKLNETNFKDEIRRLADDKEMLIKSKQENESRNNLLNMRINEIENEIVKLLENKESEVLVKHKNEEIKQKTRENKLKVIDDLQSKIMMFRNERWKQNYGDS